MSKHNIHNKAVGSFIERSKERIYDTGEVFTPMKLCYHIVSKIPLEKRKDPNSIFMDNTAGNGNFMVALRDELIKYHSLSHINDNMLYAVELMPDNHAEMCKRVGVSTTHPHFV